MRGKRVPHAFAWGGLFAINLLGAFQDCVGKAGYINLVETMWVNSRLSFPIHVVLVALSLYLVVGYAREEAADGQEG